MGDVIKTLQYLIDTQASDVNCNCDSYMHAQANGIILAKIILTGDDPEYKKVNEQDIVN